MTDFKHFVCWDRDLSFKVLNPEAERVDREVFLAVHTDRPLRVATAAAGGSFGERQEEMSADEFLRRFLAENEPHVQAVIVGGSGTGKSHFIKWLSLKIAETPTRQVFTIPKTGTSLRRILELIIDRLPEAEADRYREGLAGDSYEQEPPIARRKRLAYEISLALGTATPLDADEKYLLDNSLRLIFGDPHLESLLVRDGGVIAHFVDHIGEVHGYTRSDTNRVFEVEDLPLLSADTAHAALETRKALGALVEPELQAVAVRLVNRVLPLAIARVLNFSPDRLIEVMTKVRQHLARQGQELVLLIEDFARLQGIDGGLLQALVTEGGGDSGLCKLRWAMAVTAGYYRDNVRDTVKTRLKFEVDMTETAAAISSNSDDLIAFASRYLNASRARPGELLEWAAREADDRPPNRCEWDRVTQRPCEFRDQCHAAFGHERGVGLYPFSRTALPRMYERLDPSAGDQFNPRRFIKGVLRSAMVDHLVEWDAGIFPSKEFHRAVGDGPDPRKITGVRDQQIDRADPANKDRQKALLDFWGDDELSIDKTLPPVFGLRPLSLWGSSVGGQGGTGTAGGAGTGTGGGEPAQRSYQWLLDELADWGFGRKPLSENAVGKLRPWLFSAIETAIDWDTEGIAFGFFAGTDGRSKYFKPSTINFQRQRLARMPGEVELLVPLVDDDEELRDTSVALQTLVELRMTGSLAFAQAAEGYAALAARLPQWAGIVRDQIRDLVDRLGPIDSAAELLIIATALDGRPIESPSDCVNEVLSDNLPRAVYPPGWGDAMSALNVIAPIARDLLRAATSASKGGQQGTLIRPRLILAALDRLKASGWTPSAGEGNSPVARAHASLVKMLPRLVEEERMRQIRWSEDLDAELGGRSATEFKEVIRGMRNELAAADIGSSPDKERQAMAGLDLLQAAVIERQRQAVRVWATESRTVGIPDLAVPERWGAVDSWDVARPSIVSYLDEAEAAVSSTADVGMLQDAIDKKGVELRTLLEELAALTEGIGLVE